MIVALLTMAFRNTLYHWRYSLGAMLAIAASFAALALFSLYMIDVMSIVERVWERRFMYGHLILERRAAPAARARAPWAYLLDERDQAFLDRYLADGPQPAVNVVKFLLFSGTISNGRTSTLVWAKGYDAAAGARMRGETWAWDAVAGKPLHLGNGLDDIVLGRRLARLLGCSVAEPRGDLLRGSGYVARERPFACPAQGLQVSAGGAHGRLGSVDVSVVGVVDGVFSDVDSRLVMMPLELTQRLLETRGVSYYTVELPRGVDLGTAARGMVEAAAKAGLTLAATPWKEHPDGAFYERMNDGLTIFRRYIDFVMVSITLLSVGGAFAKMLDERTREIGTLRAVGFRPGFIAGLFEVEALLLAVAGVTLGAVATVLTAAVLNWAQFPYQVGGLTEPVPFRFAADPAAYATAGMVVVAAALVSAAVVVTGKLRRHTAANLSHT